MTSDTSSVSPRTWAAILAATLGAFLALLNIHIVGAASADIQGAIGATPTDAGWISTSYLVAEIVVIPLTAWLAKVFSVRRYLVVNAALFLVFSVACASARTLDQMIVLRALQGLSGGVLIPMAFTLIITLLPPARQPTGLALFALAAAFAPAMGPTVGGWLAGNWGWQAIFYVNLVPGLAALILLSLALPREPMQLDLLRRGDWAGIVTMVLGLGTLQVVLEEGSREDWFESVFITRLAIVAAVSLTLFVWIELRSANPLLNLRLLGRRNFGLGTLAMFLLGLALYGTVFVLPGYLARVQGYSAEQIGLVLAWAGLPQLLVVPFVPVLMRTFDARWLVVGGLALLTASSFMNIGISTDVAGDQFIVPNIVRAVGQALALTPLTAFAVAGIAVHDTGSASALLNVMRNLGGAVGIAGLQTLLTTRQQFHSSVIGESVSLFDEATRNQLDQFAAYFMTHGVGDPATAWRKAAAAIAGRIDLQASAMAFGDAFYLLSVALLAVLGLALLLRKPATAAAGGAH
jgi:DHA2 family multidrug resistance protein